MWLSRRVLEGQALSKLKFENRSVFPQVKKNVLRIFFYVNIEVKLEYVTKLSTVRWFFMTKRRFQEGGEGFKEVV